MADLKKIQVDGQVYDINVPDGKIGTDQLKDGRVALAENLVGRGSVPAEYTFRTAGGSADLGSGSALIKMLKGRTLVWNQLVQKNTWSESEFTNGVKVYSEGDTVVVEVAEGGATAGRTVENLGIFNFQVYGESGHKRLVLGIPQNMPSSYVKMYTGYSLYDNNIIIASGENAVYYGVVVYSGAPAGKYVFRPMIIDLTVMFGAGNEPSTVAEFEALFPLDYYAYNAGQLLSVTATGIETVGFNAYNPETGKAILLGGHKYQVSGTYTALDFNGAAPALDGEGCFTPSEDGELTVTGGNNTDTCVHLVWSGYRNGEYEPYWSETRQLPITTLTGKKDGAGESVVIFGDGFKSAGSAFDEITANGAVKRIGKVDMGTLNWGYNATYGYFGVTLSDYSGKDGAYICSKYAVGGAKQSSDMSTAAIGMYNWGTALYVKDTAYSDAAAFKAAMSGVYLYYELDTPETYVLDEPLTLAYEVDDFGTEKELPQNDDEPVTAPIRYDVQYAMNAVDTLRRLPVNYISKESMEAFLAELDSALGAALSATVETTMSWDADNEKYTFSMTVTPNAEPEP